MTAQLFDVFSFHFQKCRFARNRIDYFGRLCLFVDLLTIDGLASNFDVSLFFVETQVGSLGTVRFRSQFADRIEGVLSLASTAPKAAAAA